MKIKSLLTSRKFALVFLLALTLVGCGKEKKWDQNPATVEEEKKKHNVDHLLIEEIAYAGAPVIYSDKKVQCYGYDYYVKICNPSLEVKYIDGMVLMQAAISSSLDYKLEKEDIKALENYFPASAVYRFPGSGKDYPIAPGASITVALVAVDHTKKIGNEEYCLLGRAEDSYDLSQANFQIWSEQQISNAYIEEKPKTPVPSLTCVFLQDDYVFALYPKILEDFPFAESMLALANFDETKLKKWEFKEEIRYSAAPNKQHNHPRFFFCLAVPYELIVDAVNLCPTQEFKRLYMPKTLDATCTGVRKSAEEIAKEYAGKAVIRRHDGRNYVDNNNSSLDFQIKPASLTKQK